MVFSAQHWLYSSDGNSDEDQSSVVRRDRKESRVNPMIQRVEIVVSNKNVESIPFTGGSSLTLFWCFYRRSDKEGGERRCFLQREWRRQRRKEDHFVLQVHALCGTSWFIFMSSYELKPKSSSKSGKKNPKNQLLYQEPMSKALKSPSARVCDVLNPFQIFLCPIHFSNNLL